MAALNNVSLYSDNCCAIHFNNELSLDEIGPTTKGCDRIGALWSRLRESQTPSEKISLMHRLGVCETDRDAHRDLMPLLQIIFKRHDVEITPKEDVSGVYYLSCNGDRFAVFKIGEKRARTELLARKIAHRAGLEKYAIAGIACTIEYPRFPEPGKEPVEVELFNGNVAVYSNNNSNSGDYNKEVQDQNDHLKTPYKVAGILEPFITGQTTVNSAEDFAKLIAFALLIGLRDGKLDGMLDGKLFDLEDIMPERMIPDEAFDRNVAATHLPLLEHPLAKAPIPIAILQQLNHLISEDSFSLKELTEELAHEMVGFADLAAESLTLKEEMSKELCHVGWSDGGCPLQIEPALKIMDQYPVVKVHAQNACFLTTKQIRAFSYRVLQLRSALEHFCKMGAANSLGLVFAVDPLYAAHWEVLQGLRLSPEALVGRTTPKSHQRQSRLSPELVKSLIEERELEKTALTRARSYPTPNTSS